jgi:tRNA (uracil-5-)-methyltransferase
MADGSPVSTGPMEFANANLIKLNTFDEFSSIQQAKKVIGKFVPPAEGAAEGTPEATSRALKGLVRGGKNPSMPYLFLSYDTPENRDEALKAILGTVKTRAKEWVQEEVTARDMQVTHKKGKRERDGTQVGGAAEQGPSVAPWMNLAYKEQLDRKQEHCRGILKTINKYSAIREGSMRTGAMLTTVVRSPMLVAYRNNVQLSCGLTGDGAPMVGFNAGQSVEGVQAVIPPHDVPTVHPIALAVTDAFMSAVFEPRKEALPMYTKAAQRGFWRKLHIRHNKEAEVLLDIEVNPTGIEPAVLDEARAALREWASGYVASVPPAEWESEDLAAPAASTTSRFVSLQWHFYAGTSTAPNDLPREVLFGGPTLLQTLFDLQFDLSPEAFFQVNRLGTEHLLQRVVTEAELNSEKTILLDLCCGTGTIGLCLSKHVQRVVGVEMVPGAVENAKVNAQRNGVSNATFVCGKVENAVKGVLDEIMDQYRATPSVIPDIVAILDPPRSGMHNTVLKWLRNCPAVRRLVYISCDQRALEVDCEPLCKPASKNFGGWPFKVCNAFGVDLFPHTPHVEMIVTMRRVAKAELEAIAQQPRDTQQQQPAAPALPAQDDAADGMTDMPKRPQPSAE